jgi:hypothetical protein
MSETTTVMVGGRPVTLADGWQRLDIPGAEVALAGPATTAAADGSMFRPSFTVIVAAAAPDADVRTLATQAVAGVRAAIPTAHVLAYDVWPLPDGHPGGHGRRLLLTFQQDAVPLVVRQWIAVADGVVTTVTATTSVTQHLGLERALDDLAAQALSAPPDPGAVARSAAGVDVPVPPLGADAPLPRLDPYLADDGLEDLSRIGPSQPFASDGPRIAGVDVDVLAAAVAGPQDDPPAALVAAGLLDADGALTPEGTAVARVLAAPTGRVRVESGRGRAPLTLDVYARDGVAVAVATASPASLVEAPHGDDLLAAATSVQLDMLDTAAVPGLVAAWVGLAPAWSLATEPAELPEELVTTRVDAPEVPPPPGADAHLRHVWDQPWTLWTLRSGTGDGVAYVNAGRCGQLALTAAEGDAVGLAAVPSAQVWSTLVAVSKDALAG